MSDWQSSVSRTIYNKLISGKPVLQEEISAVGEQTIPVSALNGAVEELLEADYRRSIGNWLRELIDAQDRGDTVLADRMLVNKPVRASTSRYVHISEGFAELEELAASAKDPKGRIVRMPFTAFRDVIGDLGPGSLHVIGGEPGSMKSAFIEQIDLAAGLKYKGAVYSLEMVRSVKLARYAQHLYGACVGPRAIQTATADLPSLAKAKEALLKRQLFIDDKPDNIISLIDSMELLEQEQDPDYYSIDFLQLLNPLPGETDYQSVKNNVKQIYHFAKKYNKPVLLLSQLNRESRKDIYGWKGDKVDKLPKMTDLEGAGTIEQVAHSVTFIQPVEDDNYVRRVYIAKNRNGASPHDFGQVPVVPEEMNFRWEIEDFYKR